MDKHCVSSALLSSTNMSPMHFTAKQQTAAALLPVSGKGGQVQHHEGAAGLAVGGRASEGGLEEVGELLIETKKELAKNSIISGQSNQDKNKKNIPLNCDKARAPLPCHCPEQR